MGWCKNCNIYYKKMSNREICNNCSAELYGTPPGMNSMMMQYYNTMKKQQRDDYFDQKFKSESNLMDLSASALLERPDLLIELSKNLEDFHPPWHALLKAWYRKNKCKGKSLYKEKYPMKKLFTLMNITNNDNDI